MTRVFWLAALALASTLMATGCKKASTPEDQWSEHGLMAVAEHYIADASYRRAELERSLVNPDNLYSKERLSHYGHKNRGWDLLPEWNPKTRQVWRSRDGHVLEDHTPVWDGRTPTTFETWTKLGREVFFRYPLRSERFVRLAMEHPEMGERYGIHALADGRVPGFVSYIDETGREQHGISCALCHSKVTAKGDLIVGEARRDFDFGALRLAHAELYKDAIEPNLARRLKQWGPGRADVTEDDDEDPVAIPDLWGLRHQSHLTQAGTIKQTSPAALMLRQETQLLTTNHSRTRPPRVLAAALALFLYSMEPPAEAAHAGEPVGQELFRVHCKRCHTNPAGGGDLVSHALVETDSALALGTARGTGFYRTPALIRVRNAAPYLHHGVVPSLEAMLDPSRIRGASGPSNKVGGHPYGTELSKSDRDALLRYLNTL